jgi:hypothetical protein
VKRRASLGVATLAGGAGPLLVSSSGSGASAAIAMGSGLVCFGLAALAWAAPHWHTEVRLELLRSWSRAWLRLQSKLLALDLRTLRRAPKNLALALTSHWLLRAGLAGLLGSGAFWCGRELLGLPSAAPLLGMSLSSAALVGVSQLLGWALRLQPRSRESGESLALAAQEFPAIVDASRRCEVDSVFLHPTLLHDVLSLLPSWRERVRGSGVEGHAAALQRHLWCGLPFSQIERRQPSDGIVELVIDDVLLVAVQVGVDANRARALARRFQEREARASVVVVLEAEAAALENADVSEPLQRLHAALPVVVAFLP